MSGKEECLLPDISDILEKSDILGDILEGKVEIRLRTGKRSFEEKVEAVEAVREWLKPLKEARKRHKAERALKNDEQEH